MIRIENIEINGLKPAIRGMRNPMNSWDKSDSKTCSEMDCENCNYDRINDKCDSFAFNDIVHVGKNDLDLMNRLSISGAAHAKYKRMINVYCDIVAPMYWWKEFDTYKYTVRNSCSTMHRIHAKEFTLDDFSCDHMIGQFDDVSEHASVMVSDDYNVYDLSSMEILGIVVQALNHYRNMYQETNDKKYWWQMIQLLPSSYNQRSTVMMNYETLTAIYRWRRTHKLDEWQTFCDWIESLPYSELITGKKAEDD